MKNLFVVIAVLLCLNIQAQKSIKVKEGSQLVYEIEDGGHEYKLTVKVESMVPLKVTYKTSNGNYKGTMSNTAKNQDEFDYKFFMPVDLVHPGPMVFLPKSVFTQVEKLHDDYKDGKDIKKSIVKLSLTGNKQPENLANLNFQVEEIVADTKDVTLATYAMSGDFVNIRINMDPANPLVTYLNDNKGFSIHLIEATGVEVYTIAE